MNCPSCAASVSEHANFCTFCGLHLSGLHDSAVVRKPEGEHLGFSPRRGSAEGIATAEAAPTGRGKEAGIQTCPRCGAANGPRRMMCGRCGAHLSSKSVAPPLQAVVDEPVEVTAASPARWRLVLAIVTLSALVGTLAGALVLMRVRGENPAVAAPVFDRTAYPEQSGDLEIAEVTATSTLAPRGSITYAAELVVDGDPQTAWNEGAEPGRGEGESLRMRLAQPAWVARLLIRNGYQKDQATFFDNARASRLLARFDDGSLYELVLLDRMGEQVVEFPVPALTRAIVLEVIAAYPGVHYDDLALSEVLPQGWVARGADEEGAVPMFETPA
ncbi:MAG: hypothetical protein M3N32_02830 [Actinomycetota bacterium]|nr:hypothetical protein [Actinomycetota bacterium]